MICINKSHQPNGEECHDGRQWKRQDALIPTINATKGKASTHCGKKI